MLTLLVSAYKGYIELFDFLYNLGSVYFDFSSFRILVIFYVAGPNLYRNPLCSARQGLKSSIYNNSRLQSKILY